MKVVLISMPDVAAVMMHEAAFHLPNLGIASIAGNVDDEHEVCVIDLIRQRRNPGAYLTRTLSRIRPDLVGLSAMTWQFGTCLKLARLIKALLPEARIAVGGYHATLMHEEIAASGDCRDIDFLIRGEGEEPFRRLVNALRGTEDLARIPSLSYRHQGGFIHNPRGELIDLARLKRPVRDKRRLTWGYHVMNRSIEVIETSRGCTRNCNFCSIRHMYGRSFRVFPIERILADIDEIYFQRRCRRIFIVDDNMVLSPDWVMEVCQAIIGRGYRDLHFIVQADCVTISRNEEMVRTMARAGFKGMFLGIENASRKNLVSSHKGDIVEASRKAVAICHKYGIMVIGGMIFGFPDDEEADIIGNYSFLKDLGVDSSYCQILTPYPKTGIRDQLVEAGLVTNRDDFSAYNGLWANVRTYRLDSKTLHYLVWLHRQQVLGWWDPSPQVRSQGRLWTSIWIYAMRPLLQRIKARNVSRYGMRHLYEREVARLKKVNRFPDLEPPRS
jgi:anaerobic magnesium-protoporphyrin IX monomethyl ester cyclase